MAGLWGLRCHWRPARDRHVPDQDLVYVYFLLDPGIPDHHLRHPGFLDEYEAVYARRQEKSPALFVRKKGKR